MTSTTATHWRAYASEAGCLGAFMCSAAAFATLLQHPSSPLAIGGASALARLPMGLAMGVTLVALVYSPWGRHSGAHMNPVLTLAFLRLGKITPRDAAMYMVAQVIGGTVGISLATGLLANLPADATVNYVATLPGPAGATVAAVAEAAISFGMMFVVLVVSNHPRANRYTGVCAAALVAAYITFEAPISGMSMNPARSLGPAWFAGSLDTMWIYLLGPLAGMMLGAECYLRIWGPSAVYCAKLNHPIGVPCIFRCRFGAWETTPAVSTTQAEKVSA